ncbi:hypothetical protein BY996DRAFT_6416347 [Phakopsora pachyrhizi]|nr:hypothetical protein BY996DRAFT_6416347 [Phakopsora pachyrhizi]
MCSGSPRNTKLSSWLTAWTRRWTKSFELLITGSDLPAWAGHGPGPAFRVHFDGNIPSSVGIRPQGASSHVGGISIEVINSISHHSHGLTGGRLGAAIFMPLIAFVVSIIVYVLISHVLRYVYLGVLIMCFLLAMGNQPQGSKLMFTTALVVFALITVYMTFAGIFISVKGLQNAEAAIRSNGGSFNIGDVFANTVFRNIVLSLVATYGLWLLASFMFFELWHMFTSFMQYILISPSMINVINIYAFCNVHNISWGTKGDNKVKTDLGVVKAADNGKTGKVDINVPTDEKDINAAYDNACHVLPNKPPPEKEGVDVETKMTDGYQNIRTNVVLAWTLTNVE